MRIRWFGEPWPDAADRAAICADDTYRVSAPIGQRCIGCEKPIYEHERGVIMAGSPEIPNRFVLTVRDPDTRETRPVYVVAYHRVCLLLSIAGPDLDLDLDLSEPVLGRCPHGVNLDTDICSEGCRV